MAYSNTDETKNKFYSQNAQRYMELYGGHFGTHHAMFVGQSQIAGAGIFMDFLKHLALPVLKKAAPHLLTMGSKVLTDVGKKKTPLKESLKKRSKEAAVKILKGEGKKKAIKVKKKNKKTIIETPKKKTKKKKIKPIYHFPIFSS